MGTESGEPLRVFFFPLMSPGHMLPALDMSKLFALRGAAAAFITTPGNEPLVRPSLDRFNSAHPSNPVALLLLPFPPAAAALLPGGRENLASVSSADFPPLMAAANLLRDPLLALLRARRPDCLVSDAIFPWTADLAGELSVPRLVFHGPGAFPLCVHRRIEDTAPHVSDADSFDVDGLPHRLRMTRPELSPIFDWPEFLKVMRGAEERSHGVVVNTFHELEPAYAELYRRKLGGRAWFVGPVSLCDPEGPSGGDRGGSAHPDFRRWLAWLDCQKPCSVIYVCFGSLCEFAAEQLKEIAAGLEISGHPFVWVVKDGAAAVAGGEEELLPEGFVGRGLVIRGWAPQVAMLGHEAVGGFVTHCGWNSTLEAVAAGLPVATWPLSFEQFLNEKFLTEVLGIGTRVRRRSKGSVVKAEEVAAAVERVMGGGEEAEGWRRRAREFAAKARKAMAECGSSFADVDRLIEGLVLCRPASAGAL